MFLVLPITRNFLELSVLSDNSYRTPSQTAHLLLSPFGVSNAETQGWCYIVAFTRAGALAATLPSTLYGHLCTTTADCSKDLWGLLVPLRVSGICTGHRIRRTSAQDSEELVVTFMLRQKEAYFALMVLDASFLGRQLIDKGLRYLSPWRSTCYIICNQLTTH